MNNKVYKSTNELTPFISEVINNGKSVKLTVTGNSMFPLFTHERDIVEIKKSPVYRKRDVILYVRTTGDLVLHRIVKKKEGVFYLCGDNQTAVEFPIYEDQIIGKLISYERKGKASDCDSFLYRIYSFLWCVSIKLRKPVLRTMLKVWELLKQMR